MKLEPIQLYYHRRKRKFVVYYIYHGTENRKRGKISTGIIKKGGQRRKDENFLNTYEGATLGAAEGAALGSKLGA